MAKKTATPTPDDVDNMSDEEITAFMNEQQEPETPEDGDNGTPEPEKAEDAPKSEPEAESGAESVDDRPYDDEPDPKSETVPFKSFEYQRQRRKEAEAQKREAEERWQKRFDELTALLQQKGQPEPEKAEQPQIPDWDQDPISAGKWTQEQLLAFKKEAEDQSRQQAEQQRQQAEQRQLLEAADVEYQAAISRDPSVEQAYKAVTDSYVEEIKFYGQMSGMTPAQMQQQFNDTMLQHIAYARQSRQPIGDYITGLAKLRGWQPQSAQPEPEQQRADPAVTREKAKSLSNGGGSPGVSSGLTAQQMMDMSDKEFDALIEKYGSVADALAAQ